MNNTTATTDQAQDARLKNALEGLLAHAEHEHEKARRAHENAVAHDGDQRTPGAAYLWDQSRKAHKSSLERSSREFATARRALARFHETKTGH